MKELKVNLSSNSYSIFIEEDLLSHLGDYIKKVYKNKRVYINTKAIGSVGFPYPATYHTKYNDLAKNMDFSDGNKNFRPD